MIHKIINLGYHPLADSFLNKNQIKKEKKKKLECYLNSESKRLFIKSNFNSSFRYNNVDYSYTSSNSNMSKKHWDNFFEKCNKFFKISKKKILEIGSNDGYLLKKFQKFNTILGVDASKIMASKARTKGIPTLNMSFNFKESFKIKKKYGQFDFIIANHVLNHSDNEFNFLKGAKNLMFKNSILILEVPYWGFQIKNNYFDQIYHEHRSYYTIEYIIYLSKKLDLKITNFEIVNYHGKSIRIFLSKKKSEFKEKKMKKILQNEKKLKLYNLQTYRNFMKKITTRKKNLRLKINKIIKKNKIIAVGASAKGNTFLNFVGLTNKEIYAVTDNSYYKINKYTPGSNIKIRDDYIFKKFKKVYAIILSWNFSKSLKKKILKYNKRIRFIK